MSRSQFVRNTLGTIQMQLQPPEQLSTSDLAYDDSGSSMRGSDADTIARTKRSDSITSWNSVSKEAAMAASPGHHSNGSTPSVQVSLHSSQQRTPDVGSVYGRSWEVDMENLLKVNTSIFPFTIMLIRSINRKCTTQSRVNKFSNQLLVVHPYPP